MKTLIASFTATADQIAPELITWSWQALLLLACVRIGLKLYGSKSPALRHNIWLIALIAVACLPAANLLGTRFPDLQPSSPALNFIIHAPRSVTAIAPPQVPPRILPIPGGLTTRSTRATSLRAPRVPNLRPLVVAVWIAGALIVLVRLSKSHLRLRRTHRLAVPVTPQELGLELEGLRDDRIRLRLSPDIQSPLLYGFIRPTILLPSDLIEWTTPAERAAMVRHELAHVERGDALVNLFQTTLHIVFFFHPLVRYACRQLSVEREMACDDRVIVDGATAEVYAEGILKAAERSITPGGVHQLALFSARQILERRIEMILNRDRVRLAARQWKYLIIPAAAILIIAWLLIPTAPVKSGLAQPKPEGNKVTVELIRSIKGFDELIEIGVNNPDQQVRWLAAVRLTELEGDGSTPALVRLYQGTQEEPVKKLVITTLARLSEIEPLLRIAQSDPSTELRRNAAWHIKYLKETSESADVRAFDVSAIKDLLREAPDDAPPPPPPPPPPLPPPPPPATADLTVEEGKPLTSLRWHNDENSIFYLLRELVAAHMRHDAGYFEKVLEDHYLGIGPDGVTHDKAQEIAEIKRLDQRFRKFEFDDVRVSGTGSTSLATFLGTVYFEENGRETTAQYRYTVNFTHFGGEPKVVGIHITKKL